MGKRGLKVVMLPNYIKRPIAAAGEYPEAARYAFRLDTYGIDSEYDYDPVWARCQELGVAATFHSPGEGWGSRTSISSFVYNHIGHFAAAGEATAKSLFMGGVTRRFPEAEIPLSRRRRGLGAFAPVRPGGALGEAQPARGDQVRSAHRRSRAA